MPRPILLSAHARNMEEIYTIPELHHFLDAINAQEMDKAYAHVPDTYELGHGVIGQISLAAICVHQNKIEHFRFLLGKKTVPVLGYIGSAHFLLSALKAAIYDKKFDLVDELLGYSMVAAHLHENQNSVLQTALRGGHTDLARRLLENKKIKSSIRKNEIGTSLVLQAAIESGKLELLDLLLNSFVLFREPSKHDCHRWAGGRHILDDAFEAVGCSGSIDLLNRLLTLDDYRTYFHGESMSRFSMMSQAAANGHTDLACHLMDTSLLIRQAVTPQAWWIEGILRQAIDNNHIETARALIRYPEIRLHHTGGYGDDAYRFPIIYTIKCGQTGLAHDLLTYSDVIQAIKDDISMFLSELTLAITPTYALNTEQWNVIHAIFSHLELSSLIYKQQDYRTMEFSSFYSQVLSYGAQDKMSSSPSIARQHTPEYPAQLTINPLPTILSTTEQTKDQNHAISTPVIDSPSLGMQSLPSSSRPIITEPLSPFFSKPVENRLVTVTSNSYYPRFFASTTQKAIDKLHEYRFKRSFENTYTSPLGWLLSLFGSFSKKEKLDAAMCCIQILKGERAYHSLPLRQQKALSQGRLGEITKELPLKTGSSFKFLRRK